MAAEHDKIEGVKHMSLEFERTQALIGRFPGPLALVRTPLSKFSRVRDELAASVGAHAPCDTTTLGCAVRAAIGSHNRVPNFDCHSFGQHRRFLLAKGLRIEREWKNNPIVLGIIARRIGPVDEPGNRYDPPVCRYRFSGRDFYNTWLDFKGHE